MWFTRPRHDCCDGPMSRQRDTAARSFGKVSHSPSRSLACLVGVRTPVGVWAGVPMSARPHCRRLRVLKNRTHPSIGAHSTL